MYTLLQSHCNLIQQCKTEVDKAVCTTIITKSIIYKFLFFIQFLCATKITISLMESSTHIYLLKITCRNIADKIIAFESLTFWWKQPMIFVPDENYVMIQPLFIVLSVVTPFVSGLIERVTPPLTLTLEMAIFKIKIGLWKNPLFQFGQISGYFGPSILYAHDTIAKKIVSKKRRKKKFSFTQTNHKLFYPW